jgi:hypothetical protein
VVQREADVGKKEYPVPSDRQSLQEDSAPCGRNRRQRSQEENQTEAIAASRRKSETLRCEGDIMTNGGNLRLLTVDVNAPLKGGWDGIYPPPPDHLQPHTEQRVRSTEQPT